MTHLGPSPDHIATDLEGLRYVSSGADLFFSGHTGLPFLMSLLFWENKKLRYIFLFCSVAAAVAVILGHLHYTIDVFSAFFITYGVFHISQRIFKRDYSLFRHGLSLQ
jgi:membrane-associated phospholipid phosphatase